LAGTYAVRKRAKNCHSTARESKSDKSKKKNKAESPNERSTLEEKKTDRDHMCFGGATVVVQKRKRANR